MWYEPRVGETVNEIPPLTRERIKRREEMAGTVATMALIAAILIALLAVGLTR